MKKYVFILMAAFLVISITACGNKADSTATDMSDTTVKTTNDAVDETGTEAADTLEKEDTSSDKMSQLDFSATDINGESVDTDNIKDSKLIMVNFWEPWCGPCVKEMPDLEKLYQNYKDQGFVILGVFYSLDSLDDAKAVIDDINITYPILIGNEDFFPFMTAYVPTTALFDSEGNLLSSEPLIGARSYDDWEQEILKYLND